MRNTTEERLRNELTDIVRLAVANFATTVRGARLVNSVARRGNNRVAVTGSTGRTLVITIGPYERNQQ